MQIPACTSGNESVFKLFEASVISVSDKMASGGQLQLQNYSGESQVTFFPKQVGVTQIQPKNHRNMVAKHSCCCSTLFCMHGTALRGGFSAMHFSVRLGETAWIRPWKKKNPAKAGFCSFFCQWELFNHRERTLICLKWCWVTQEVLVKTAKRLPAANLRFLCIKLADVSFGYKCLRWLLKESNLALNCHCASCWGPSTEWLLSAFFCCCCYVGRENGAHSFYWLCSDPSIFVFLLSSLNSLWVEKLFMYGLF